jgi:maltokinase
MSALEDLWALLAGARWFGGKGREASVTGTRRLGVLPGASPTVVIDLVRVEYADGGEPDLYQVPLSFYEHPQERLDHSLIGVWDDPDFGRVHAYDALHDREAMALWLDAFAAQEPPQGPLLFHRVPGHELDTESHSTLFTGEQSNSSVRFGEDAVMKVFRKVTPGVNPDISIHEVLTRAGSDHVAALYGWLDVVDDDSDAVIQLAMLQQFLRTASDGWELALASVRNLYAEADLHPDEVGGDFAGEAARLGVALRETHEVLADNFPRLTRTPDELAELAGAMHRRLDEALAVVPDLAPYADRLHRAYDAVATLSDVEVQQVHGDLHLGQTLRTVKGWKIVDFEGEPARPLAERMLPDSVWRDVAGMMRSFDYAPRAAAMNFPTGEGSEQRDYRAREWSARNRAAFLEAYRDGPVGGADRTLLTAYTADKAVYEAVYEARNRPGWLGIPLAGLEQLVTHDLTPETNGDTA